MQVGWILDGISAQIYSNYVVIYTAGSTGSQYKNVPFRVIIAHKVN